MEVKDYGAWLKRAKSNLELAKNISKDAFNEYGGEIFFEDACFELQQSKAVRLTPYAVITRYPNFAKIDEAKYQEALQLADSVYNWVKNELEK